MGGQFTPVFLLMIVATAIAASMIIASAVLAPRKDTRVKLMPYESGMDPIGDARQRFDVRFYLVAIVFLLFDVELLFLYPWAVAQWSGAMGKTERVAVLIDGKPAFDTPAAGQVEQPIGVPAPFRAAVFWEMMVFIAILAAAFAYAWRKGVFEWR
jgi:NADH-quinone oxidoreductase subunit A